MSHWGRSFLGHFIILSIKTAFVTVPTPPGTGVQAPAFSLTSSKSISPTIFPSLKFIPTSISIAPSFISSFFKNFALPIAIITISALFVSSERFLVFEWQTVTVAFFASNCGINGFPTILLLPTTTTFFPSKSIL